MEGADWEPSKTAGGSLEPFSPKKSVGKPTASIIICCYTEERLEDIHEAVQSVLAQTLRPHEVIISVDHNKQLYEILKSCYVTSQQTQQTQGTLSTPQTKVVLNEGAQGLSETRNAGIRAASGEIIAFIDDDAVAEPDWLENLVKPFRPSQETQTTQGTVVAVGGRAIPLWSTGRRPSWFPEELDWIIGCTYRGLPTRVLKSEGIDPNAEFETSSPDLRPSSLELSIVRNVPGCNMAFRRGVFARAGFFTSETGRVGATAGCGEETELCLRISRALPEALIVYQEHATIHHKVNRHRTTWRHLWRRSYNEGFYKSLIKRLSSDSAATALSTEDSYLRYLVFKSIRERLSSFYKEGKLLQVAAVLTTITATGVGYILGRIRNHG
jgi:glycosyltransferase involved in cell wall biosynthesis